MSDTLRAAAQQALEALETYERDGKYLDVCRPSITALRAALAEPVSDTLPPLPEPKHVGASTRGMRIDTYTADQMIAFRAEGIAAAVAEPVASVTECEACFTPDVCQLRGTCDHYAAERLRVAAPPQREPLTDEQIDAMYSASYRTRESDYATNWYWYERGIREGERAHGITKEAP